MPTSSFTLFDIFVQDVAHGVHDLETDQLTVALTDTLPVVTNTLLTNITEVTYTNLSTRNLTTSTSTQTSGTYALTVADLTLTSTGGATGPFRYVVVYNDGTTAKVDPLIGWYDYGSSITLNDGESLTIDLNQASGMLTLS